MANILTVNYTHDFLDQMRCSVCKGYLSHSPIRLLPDGTCICGSCTPANMEVQVYRALHLEIFLQQLSFPCRFQERGCTENLLFNQATDHESKCIYRSFPCLSLTDCKWEGFSVSDCHNHFSEQHPELVKESADFKFKMNEDSNDVFITTKDKMVFVIKYLYKVQESCLKYDVRYFKNTGKNEGSYKVHLFNDGDADCSFSLKTNKCLIFDHSFYNAGNMVILKVNKYSEILDNPITVRIVINLEVIKSSGVCTRQMVKVVDYDLLETIRCKKCNHFLIPPVFCVELGNICGMCAESDYSNPPLSTNEDLIKLLSQINYPCRWHDCNFIGNSGNILRHNLFCKFRLYCCNGLNCNQFISIDRAKSHLRVHKNFKYSEDGICKFILPKASETSFIWTVKNNILIAIKHIYHWDSNRQDLELLSDLCKCTVTVQLEHQHCKVKSKPYILVSNILESIPFNELPSCFRISDQLTLQIGDCVFEY